MLFRSAHGSHPDWSVAVDECLLRLQQFAGDERYVRAPNLGFLYLTDPFVPHADRILTTLKTRTGIANWVGTCGIGICADDTEFTEEPALSVLLGQFAPGSFNVFSGTQRPPALGTRTDQGADAAHTALVHVDPATPDLPELIVDMAHKVSSGYLFGGLASARAGTIQIADRVLAGGVSGVVFASDVALVSRVSQGVHPLPRAVRREVTRATQNLILQLDGRPAFDVLLEDAGIREELPAGQTRATSQAFARVREQLQALGRQGLFVGIERSGEFAYRERRAARALRADYVARHVVALDPAKGIVAVAAPIEEGDAISFCTRDEEAARKDLVRACAQIREHLHEHGDAPPRGALYVSCTGRGSHMFGAPNEELQLIRRQLGDVPLAGFHASGEIGGSNLYGYTGVLTVFY